MFLTKYASKVTVIAREPDFTCAKSIGDKVKAHPKIEVRFHTELIEATGDSQLRHAKFKNNETGEITEYHAADGDTFGIFVFVGYAPETKLFKGIIDLDPAGFIPTNEDLMTNVEGRSEEHTSELQSRQYLVCRLLLEKKKDNTINTVKRREP